MAKMANISGTGGRRFFNFTGSPERCSLRTPLTVRREKGSVRDQQRLEE